MQTSDTKSINLRLSHLEELTADFGPPAIVCQLVLPEHFPFQYAADLDPNIPPLEQLAAKLDWVEDKLDREVFIAIPKSAKPTITIDGQKIQGTRVPLSDIRSVSEDAENVYLRVSVSVWLLLGGGLNYDSGTCTTYTTESSTPIKLLINPPTRAVGMPIEDLVRE